MGMYFHTHPQVTAHNGIDVQHKLPYPQHMSAEAKGHTHANMNIPNMFTEAQEERPRKNN